MYQTLQQSLKKFQRFVEKWPILSERNASDALQTELVSQDCDGAQEELLAEGESSEWLSSSPSLLDQFKVLKEVWMEERNYLESCELPQYGQALHTEIHKQFRLMEVDIVFLNTARQAKTIAQRKRQLSDRLRQVSDYCETGIKLSQQKP